MLVAEVSLTALAGGREIVVEAGRRGAIGKEYEIIVSGPPVHRCGKGWRKILRFCQDKDSPLICGKAMQSLLIRPVEHRTAQFGFIQARSIGVIDDRYRTRQIENGRGLKHAILNEAVARAQMGP